MNGRVEELKNALEAAHALGGEDAIGAIAVPRFHDWIQKNWDTEKVLAHNAVHLLSSKQKQTLVAFEHMLREFAGGDAALADDLRAAYIQFVRDRCWRRMSDVLTMERQLWPDTNYGSVFQDMARGQMRLAAEREARDLGLEGLVEVDHALNIKVAL